MYTRMGSVTSPYTFFFFLFPPPSSSLVEVAKTEERADFSVRQFGTDRVAIKIRFHVTLANCLVDGAVASVRGERSSDVERLISIGNCRGRELIRVATVTPSVKFLSIVLFFFPDLFKQARLTTRMPA